MNETVLNRRVTTCIISLHDKVKELIWNLYLNLRPIDMEEKYFLGHKCLGTHATYAVSKQVWI